MKKEPGMQQQNRPRLISSARLAVISLAVVALMLFICPVPALAQGWTDMGTLIYYNTGNVGIGTANPARLLHVRGSNGVFRLDRNASAPGFMIHRFPDGDGTYATPWKGFAVTVDATGPSNGFFLISDYGQSTGGAMTERLKIAHDGSVLMAYNGGKVGIGTTSPATELAVNGTVTAKEVVVTSTGWSDFVFAPDYPLRPLEAVEQHIATRGTLPGIPSEQEVRREGVAVGEMQAKLLEKIEELTLYAIQLNKENERLKQQNNAFERRLQALEQRPQ